MTKRDYTLLAEVVARHELPKEFIVDLCNALFLQNSNFDTERFLRNTNKYKENI